MTPEEQAAFNEAWPAKLYEGGWICATWPKEYGGKGLSTMEGVVLAEEFARAKAPLRADFFGDTLVGPTILQWGTEEQKKEFLPKILQGKMRWCQGFSEPDSGSDLASLKTTAVLDGDEWVINGQKVWTTQAQFADYCFLLARTDPDAPKHAGISYLLVPMQQAGIEVRPITQPDGTAEFNEVFFADARCPKDNVVGGLNNGWKVANTTLGFERGHVGHHRLPPLPARSSSTMVDEARANGTIDDPIDPPGPGPLLHQDPDHADQRPAHASPPTLHRPQGPGRSARSAPPTRCSGPRCTSEAMELALDIFGAARDAGRRRPGVGVVAGRAPRAKGKDGYQVSPMMSSFFFCRSETIWGGTAADPAQHRRRAGARPAEGAEGREGLTNPSGGPHGVGGDAAVRPPPPHRVGAAPRPVPGDVVAPVLVEVAGHGEVVAVDGDGRRTVSEPTAVLTTASRADCPGAYQMISSSPSPSPSPATGR